MPTDPRRRDPVVAFAQYAWSATESDRVEFRQIVQRFRATAHASPELTYCTVISEAQTPTLAAALNAGALLDIAEIRTLPGGAEIARVEISADADPMVLFLIPTTHDGVVHLVSSTPYTDRAWRKVERIIRRSAPPLSPVQLDQADLLTIAEGLHALGTVEVSRMTARFREDGSSIARGWKRSPKVLRPSPAEAVSELGRRGIPRTLTLHVEGVMSAHLRREAGATLYSGSHSDFQQLVLDRLATFASRRRDLLRGRSRAPRSAVEPVAVRFAAPVFEKVEALGLVIETLEAMPGIGVAILHRNPYLHVMATSYADGSSFDVMVTQADELAVFPGFKATMASFSMLLQQVTENLGGIEIAAAEQRPVPSLEDLFSQTAV